MIEQVVLGWVDPGEVSGRFMDSVMRILYASQDAVSKGLRPDLVVPGHVRIESGPRIASSRNKLVRRFLDEPRFKDVEWLLMLDADMTFDESLLVALFDGVRSHEGRVERPLVGGLCFGGGHGSIVPTMYEIVDPDTNDGSPVRVITDFTSGDVVQVDATGAACLLIHRGVLEAMALKFEEPFLWFAESVYLGREFGEDWTFCLRARSMGFPIYVNTNAHVGHMKAVELNETMWRTGQVGLSNPDSPTPPKPKLVIPTDADVIPLNREQRRALARSK